MLVAGATGLVGTSLVEQLINHPEVAKITILVRKETGASHPKVTEKVVDFDLFSEKDLPQNVDAAFCCLGTTIKKAGSKEAFKKVDFDYVLKLGVFCQRIGINQYHVISAMGANPKAKIFYNRAKGMMEQELQKLTKLRSIYVYHPSLLLGKRQEFRFGELVGKYFMTAFAFLFPLKSKAIFDWQVAKSMIHFSEKAEKGYHVIENITMHKITKN